NAHYLALRYNPLVLSESAWPSDSPRSPDKTARSSFHFRVGASADHRARTAARNPRSWAESRPSPRLLRHQECLSLAPASRGILREVGPHLRLDRKWTKSEK